MRIDRSAALADLPGVAHAFFGRTGGVSSGLYASLNCGPGSADAREAVVENRRRAASVLGVEGPRLLSLYQIHSAEAVRVTEPWPLGEGPKADAMATDRPGLALGVLAADCTPILFADADAGVIGAAHAGWKGALAGVAESTVALMERLGADRARIVAAIGPAIRQPAYEVGEEFRDRFVADDPDNDRWFAPGDRSGKLRFDLTGYVAARLARAGIARIDDLGACTYADPDFFSYRRTTHRAEPDYGRNVSGIALSP